MIKPEPLLKSGSLTNLTFILGPEQVCQSAIQSDDSFKTYHVNSQRQQQR